VHPVLLEVPAFGLTVRSYHTLIGVAVLVCLWLGPRWLERLEGLEPRRTRRALLLCGLAVFAGSRLHFVLAHWDDFAGRRLDALAVWSGGLHAGGGIVLLALATPVVARRLALPLGRFADGLAPTVGVGIAIARLGCFLEGCCFGTPCRLFWCVPFPQSAYVYELHATLGMLPPAAARSAPIHPLQLYFAGAGLMLTVVALWLHARRRWDGQVGLVALLLHSGSAAALEWLRADHHPRVHWGPLPQLEWVALAMTAAALGALVIAEAAHRRR
jgi:phosphatidylglycerol:prolipoprotein diacylglycerol transferase